MPVRGTQTGGFEYALCEGAGRCLPPPLYTCCAAMSRQHSVRFWVALQSSEAKQCTVSCSCDHMPVSRGYMRAQYPVLMASFYTGQGQGQAVIVSWN